MGTFDGRLGYVREPVEYFRMVPSPSAASSNLPLEGSKLADLNSNESPSSFHFLKSWEYLITLMAKTIYNALEAVDLPGLYLLTRHCD